MVAFSSFQYNHRNGVLSVSLDPASASTFGLLTHEMPPFILGQPLPRIKLL